MSELIFLIGGVLSLVVIVVFLVMASNIGMIVRILRNINNKIASIESTVSSRYVSNDTPETIEAKAKAYDALKK